MCVLHVCVCVCVCSRVVCAMVGVSYSRIVAAVVMRQSEETNLLNSYWIMITSSSTTEKRGGEGLCVIHLSESISLSYGG